MRPVSQPRNLTNPHAAFIFFLLLGAYPVLSFLWRRSYPVFTAEVALLFGLIILACVVLVLLYTRIGKGVAVLLTPLLLTAVFLIQFDAQPMWAFLCLVISLVLVLVLRHRFYLLGATVVAAMLLGALLDSREGADTSAPRANIATLDPGLPPVVHIVLDSFIGLDGLPDHPESEAVRGELMQFFAEHGMQVFPRAYSRYFRTSDSLFAALNFRDDGTGEYFRSTDDRQEYTLRENAYFEVLDNLGYRFNVYQTRHMDFCRSHHLSTDRCWVYDQPNALTVRQVPGAARRAGMLAKVMVTQSALLVRLFKGWLRDPAIAVHDPRVFENLRRDILGDTGGRAYLAHALLPHGPFAYQGDCSIRYEADPSLSYAMVRGEKDLSPEVYAYRATRYFEQVRCALASLRKLFGEMKSAGLFERAIIVLHGDHGSLIGNYFPDARNLDKLTWGDYRAHFSTLFAVRVPGGAFSSNPAIQPLSVLLRQFSGTVVSTAGGPADPTAFLDRPGHEPGGQEPYVFLTGTFPLRRVDVNIFEE